MKLRKFHLRQCTNEGLLLRTEEKYADASKKFEDIERVHPYSPYAKKALINLAYTNYARKRYTEAVSSAERFTTLYPGSERFCLCTLYRG